MQQWTCIPGRSDLRHFGLAKIVYGNIFDEVYALRSHLVDVQFQCMEVHPPSVPGVSEVASSSLEARNLPNLNELAQKDEMSQQGNLDKPPPK